VFLRRSKPTRSECQFAWRAKRISHVPLCTAKHTCRKMLDRTSTCSTCQSELWASKCIMVNAMHQAQSLAGIHGFYVRHPHNRLIRVPSPSASTSSSLLLCLFSVSHDAVFAHTEANLLDAMHWPVVLVSLSPQWFKRTPQLCWSDPLSRLSTGDQVPIGFQ
jgi:hypothetical protein